jgi:tetrahydromethanopterin S-methyltransferase subunit B
MFDRDTTPAVAGTLSGADYGIFAVSFVAILLIAVLASLCFIDWRAWFPGAENHNSLLGGVRSAVYSFMDYLN